MSSAARVNRAKVLLGLLLFAALPSILLSFGVAPAAATPTALYRGGADTDPNFTPRPTIDTDGWPLNGLSVWDSQEASCTSGNNSKVQRINALSLATVPGLQIVADPTIPGHYFITTTTEARLIQWANTRPGLLTNPPTNGPDPLTTAIRGANSGLNLQCTC